MLEKLDSVVMLVGNQISNIVFGKNESRDGLSEKKTICIYY